MTKAFPSPSPRSVDPHEGADRASRSLEAVGLATYEYDVASGLADWSGPLREILKVSHEGPIDPRSVWETRVHPEDLDGYRAGVRRALDSNRPSHYDLVFRIVREDGEIRWLRDAGRVLFEARDGGLRPTRAVGAVLDLTDHLRAEAGLREASERDRFRAALGDALRELDDPDAIEVEAVRLFRRYLDARRVHYVELVEDGRAGIVRSDARADGAASVIGRYELEDFGPSLLEALRAGRTLVIPDVQADERLSAEARSTAAALEVGSSILSPVSSDSRPAGLLVVHHREPRAFRPDEVALVEEVAERMWLAKERARAERALRASERRYRTLFESIDQGFCVIEMIVDEHQEPVDYRFLEANPAFERHTGLVGAVGRTACEMVSGLEAHWAKIYGRVATTGASVRFVEGSEVMGRWFEVSASRVGGPEEGKVALVFTDITERKRALDQLRASEERARSILESIADGLINVDRGWRITFINPRGSRIVQPMHPDVDRLVGQDIWEAFPDLRGTLFEERYRWAMKENAPVAFEAHYSGLNAWFDVRAYPSAHGLSIYFLDVTERKKAELALRESEERFRDLADNISQSAWMADETGWIFWYNRRWYEYTGTSLEEMQGWGWTKVHHPEHVDRVVTRLKSAWASGEPWEDTFPIRGKDGAYRWFLSRAHPIRDAEGRVLRWFGTNTDVTEQKLAEDRLRESDQRKDDYLAMLGHELRNPLAAVRNATEVVKHLTTEATPVSRAVQVLERQTEHMGRLIDGLLEVSRLARGKVHLEQVTLDLRRVIEGVLEDIRARVRAKKLHLEEQLPPDPVWVYGDFVRLTQVIDNLASNALKFTEAPGSLAIRLVRLEEEAEIRVSDTGIGLRPETLADIFEPFHQESQDIARGLGGLGLGLAVAKGMVTLHGGTIEAHSAGADQGSTFVVRLPLVPAPPGAEALAPADAVRPRRILIIEDNEDAAEMLRALLELRGHRPEVVGTGQEGLALLARAPAEVVLCDIGLPGMSGYEFARAVRADPGLRHLRLVAVTGYGQPEDRRRSSEAGFDAHLTKPVDLEALETCL